MVKPVGVNKHAQLVYSWEREVDRQLIDPYMGTVRAYRSSNEASQEEKQTSKRRSGLNVNIHGR